MIGLFLAAFMAMVCVLVHAEALALVERYCIGIRGFRRSLMVTWAALLSAHVLEVWLYAGMYWFCAEVGIGVLSGASSGLDYVYFSAAVYTTLGFGDILPGAGVRILSGSEALVGLCLIAWSATVTYGHATMRKAELED